MTKWDTIAWVKTLKHYDDETETETDKDATLEEKFEALVDVLEAKEAQADELQTKVEDFIRKWLNHRHAVRGGMYSGKGER